jgi:hypothetical protein
MKSKLAVLACIVLAVSACAGPKTYSQKIEERPIPNTQEQIGRECAYLRQEISRQSSVSAISNSPLAAVVSSKNIAALESRSAELNCRAAFSSGGATASNPIEQCIAACKANTDKPASECFTLCNH